MRLKKQLLILSLFLVLICCLSAVSATGDIEDIASSTDSEIITEDVQANDVISQGDNEEQQILEETNEEELQSSGTEVEASNWYGIYTAARSTNDQIIRLTGDSYSANYQITFNNNATIIGTDSSYITGGSSSLTPFLNTNSALSISFINVHFKDMTVNNLIQLAGNSRIENCTFNNIQTGTGQNSIVYNTDGTMTIVGCNFTNNNVGYGAITNYKAGSYTAVIMTVDKCRFVNNRASSEPGAINNCGILTVTDSEFTNNYAALWAGAIHTHYNANTVINNCNFTGNGAGWNGGALYTYSTLTVSNSIFKKNWCMLSAGGGAIGASRWWMGNYDITITGSTFEDNTNNCSLTNETPAQGSGGAISAQNSGALRVYDSTFINNYAAYGQAIAAYSASYDDIESGIPNLQIINNTFKNHNKTTTTDTVAISGVYNFTNNTFVNCHQAATGTNNRFINCTPSSVNNVNVVSPILNENTLLSCSILDNEILSGEYDSNSFNQGVLIDDAMMGQITYLKEGTYNNPEMYIPMPDAGFTIIGLNREKVIIKNFDSEWSTYNQKQIYTFINMTIVGDVRLDGSKKFINCTFDNTKMVIGKRIHDNHGNVQLTVTDTTDFIDCTFKNYKTEFAYIESYENNNIKFNNCNFENITADSIISIKTALSEDGVNVSNSKFDNVNINGVIDIDANEIAIFENNNPETVNAFRPAVEDSTITIEVVNRTHLKLTLKDADGNPVSGAKISLTSSYDASFIWYLDTNVEGIVFYENGDMAGNHFTWVAMSEAMKSRSVSYVAAYNETYVDYKEFAKDVVISLNNVTGDKNGNVTVTLKNKLNEVIANANVTYKVNGVESNATTDENGSFVISNLVGDNEIFVSFAGDSFNPKNITQKFTFPKEETKPAASNTTPSTPAKTTTKTTAKVTKKATKITAKKATFKAKKKTKKYSITLKAGKSAVKKVKVTLKVGKKTYKATTNSKGKATFKITKLTKKGKYTATIKFAGNKNFKATSKKVKITVKK